MEQKTLRLTRAALLAALGLSYVAGYLPVLLLTGVVCGLVTGALAAGTLQKLPGAAGKKEVPHAGTDRRTRP